MRCFENPLFDGFNHNDCTGQRDEWDFSFCNQWDHGHGGASGGSTDQDVNLVVFDESLCETVGLVGICAIVIVDEFELTAENATFFVQFFNIELKRL